MLHWRSGIIAGIPNLARHSRSLEGEPLPDYLAKSNLRFEQWILDGAKRDNGQVTAPVDAAPGDVGSGADRRPTDSATSDGADGHEAGDSAFPHDAKDAGAGS